MNPLPWSSVLSCPCRSLYKNYHVSAGLLTYVLSFSLRQKYYLKNELVRVLSTWTKLQCSPSFLLILKRLWLWGTGWWWGPSIQVGPIAVLFSTLEEKKAEILLYPLILIFSKVMVNHWGWKWPRLTQLLPSEHREYVYWASQLSPAWDFFFQHSPELTLPAIVDQLTI